MCPLKITRSLCLLTLDGNMNVLYTFSYSPPLKLKINQHSFFYLSARIPFSLPRSPGGAWLAVQWATENEQERASLEASLQAQCLITLDLQIPILSSPRKT